MRLGYVASGWPSCLPGVARRQTTRTWIPGFQQLVEWLKGRVAGHWFVGGCTQPEAIGEKVKALAVAFAKRLIDRAK